MATRRIQHASTFVSYALLSVALLPLLTGCGNSADSSSGTVSGRVSYEGQPVQQGVVTLYSSELGVGISEEIQADGQYATQTPIPIGNYVVTVLPPEEPPPMEEDLVVTIAPVKDIPEKYRDPAKSGLNIDVSQGQNSFDIEMTK